MYNCHKEWSLEFALLSCNFHQTCVFSHGFTLLYISNSSYLNYCLPFVFTMVDDGKLDTESDSGEFWVLFGGFAPIGKKVITEDDVIPEVTPAKLYRYSHVLYFFWSRRNLFFLEGGRSKINKHWVCVSFMVKHIIWKRLWQLCYNQSY